MSPRYISVIQKKKKANWKWLLVVWLAVFNWFNDWHPLNFCPRTMER